MAPKKKQPSPLTDPENDPVFVETEESIKQGEEEGMSVEDAYRYLAGMAPEPVIEAEEN